MAKRVKKKVKSGQKEKRAVPASKTPVPESDTNIETSDAVVPVVKDRSGCSHLHENFDLGKVSSKFRTSVSLKCEYCREESTDRRGGKGKGKHGKKKGGSADIAVKAIWLCLECGHFSCGGAGLPTTPQSHAVRHARQRGHPLAIQYKNPHLRWCFLCSTLIPVDNSEENGESKDILADIVKVIKAEPSEQTSGNVEDIWFGSGSVLGEIKSENSAPSNFNGAGGYVVRGLVNLGNTCFFNSVLQNLMAMDKLRVHFLKMDASVGPLTVSLKNLFVETNPEIGYKTVINPKPLFGCVCAKSPQFRGFHQQDSHELLRCLLDVLSIEESSSRKQTRSSTEKEIPPNPTFVEAIFGGMLCCSVSCLECEHSSIVYEPFLDLSLPIPAKRPPSKKVQPIAQPKKQKLPSRRSERIRSRFNGYTDSAASITDSPNGGQTFSYQVQSTAPIADNMTVSSVSSMSSDPFIQTVVGANEVPASQNLQTTEGVDSSLLCKTVSEKTIASMDDTSWLDYLELDTVTNDHDMAEQSDDTKETKDTGNADACDNDVFVQKPLESPCVEQIVFGDISGNQYFSTNDSVVGHEFTSHDSETSNQILPNDLNLEMDFKTYPWVDETPLQVQNSEVLLLPHKEDTSTNGELLNGEDRVEMDFERNSWEDEPLSQVQSSEVLLLSHKEDTSTNGELLNGEDRVEMDFERNSWEDEPLSQVQSSEVLLLPHKEDTSTNGELLNGEDRVEMDFERNSWEDETPSQVQSSEVLLLSHKEDTSTNGELLNGEDRFEMDFERNSWEDEPLSQVQSSEVLLLSHKEDTSTNGELLNGEDRVEMDFERNSWEDEPLSQVQSSEVLLLPHKEDTSTNGELLNGEDRVEMDFERNSWEDETPSQVQSSEVLLLPYKEDFSTYATTLNPEDVITTSPVRCEQHSDNFDGFGDLFNEPEVAAGPQSKPPNDESSESDLDEIDNTDSPVSVERCLSYFTKPELLSKNEHAWHCENCSKAIVKNRKSRKNIQISKADASLDEGGNGIQYAQFGQNKGHNDGIDERDALDSSSESLVLCNGVGCNLDCTSERIKKSEPHEVAALLEEDKGDISDALKKLTCNQDSSNDSCRISDSDIARCDPSNLQKTESQSIGGDHESPRSEDEQLDSKSIKVERDAKKRILIDKAPPILTIHLKRFSQDARGRLSKLNGHVGFSDTLDLKPYMHSRFAEREKYKYRLLGVVEHLGSMGGGHYVAYVRGGAKRNGDAEKETTDSMWYYASDDYIREVSFEEVLRCEAYILFYKEI